MSDALLEIRDLQVSVGNTVILDGVDLMVQRGEAHVLMGPNGSGKSTLASAIMGDPRYAITRGRILFCGQDITQEKADARARMGMFLSFQAPEDIPGVTVENFLRMAQKAVTGKQPKLFTFRRELHRQMDALGIEESYAQRYLNVGFSGGEKKKAEILQMMMLRPALAILDETDSGLDVDAVKTVAQGVRAFHDNTNALLIITHNAKILEGLDIQYVHVLESKTIAHTGGPELIGEISESGFLPLAREEVRHAGL